jgi:hypothetical protein
MFVSEDAGIGFPSPHQLAMILPFYAGKGRLFFLMAFLFLGLLSSVEAQKRGKKPAPKKSKGKSAPAASAKTPSPMMKFLYGDVFIGPSINYAGGDYQEYQKFYYATGNPNFAINGKFTNPVFFTAGAQVRIYPFRKPESFLSGLAFTAGGSFLRKGFTHEVLFVNTALDYPDETRINEEFNASFLATHLMVRYGKKLYLEAGISIDWFLSGVRSQEVIRKTSGEKAYQGGFESQTKIDYDLTTKTMASSSLGWVFGIGYQIIPMVGVRFYNNLNSKFFKDGADLRNYQPSLQVTFSMP